MNWRLITHQIKYVPFWFQLAQLQGELQRMNAENQKLKEMLTQVSNNYSALQMHLVAVMQQQQINKNHAAETTQELDQQVIIPQLS